MLLQHRKHVPCKGRELVRRHIKPVLSEAFHVKKELTHLLYPFSVRFPDNPVIKKVTVPVSGNKLHTLQLYGNPCLISIDFQKPLRLPFPDFPFPAAFLIHCSKKRGCLCRLQEFIRLIPCYIQFPLIYR